MPCHQIPDGFICTPTVAFTKVRVLYCPKCKCKRRVTMKVYEYYGATATCTAPRLKWAHFEPCGYQFHWE